MFIMGEIMLTTTITPRTAGISWYLHRNDEVISRLQTLRDDALQEKSVSHVSLTAEWEESNGKLPTAGRNASKEMTF